MANFTKYTNEEWGERMSNQEKQKQEPKKVIKQSPKKVTEAKFEVADLKEHSMELFGIKSYVFTGAFHGREDTAVTKDEAKKIIDNYLKGKGGK